MKLAPPAFSSCSPSLPLGACPPRGGGFEKPIGKTSLPSIRSTPVGAIVTVVTAGASHLRTVLPRGAYMQHTGAGPPRRSALLTWVDESEFGRPHRLLTRS